MNRIPDFLFLETFQLFPWPAAQKQNYMGAQGPNPRLWSLLVKVEVADDNDDVPLFNGNPMQSSNF